MSTTLDSLEKLNQQFPFSAKYRLFTGYEQLIRDSYLETVNPLHQNKAAIPAETRQLLLNIREGKFPADPISSSLKFSDLLLHDAQGLDFTLVTTCSLLLRWHRDHGNHVLADQYQAFLKKIYEEIVVPAYAEFELNLRKHYAMDGEVYPEDKVVTALEKQTLLHWAAATGQTAAVTQLLTDKKYRPNAEDDLNRTPFFLACLNGHLDAAKVLLDTKNATPNQPRTGMRFALVSSAPLLAAFQAGHRDLVTYLVNHPDINLEVLDDHETSLLTLACSRYDLEMMNLLLDRKVKPSVGKFRGDPTICIAASWGHVGVVTLLLNAGASAETLNDVKASPLTLACINGHLPLVQVLLSVAPKLQNQPDDKGRTPLSYACELGHHAVVACLLEHKTADVNGAAYSVQQSLWYACYAGREKCVDALLAHKPDLNVTDCRQETATALHAACRWGTASTVLKLLNAGAKTDLKNDEGYPAIVVAGMYGHFETVRTMLEHKTGKEYSLKTLEDVLEKSRYHQVRHHYKEAYGQIKALLEPKIQVLKEQAEAARKLAEAEAKAREEEAKEREREAKRQKWIAEYKANRAKEAAENVQAPSQPAPTATTTYKTRTPSEPTPTTTDYSRYTTVPVVKSSQFMTQKTFDYLQKRFVGMMTSYLRLPIIFHRQRAKALQAEFEKATSPEQLLCLINRELGKFKQAPRKRSSFLGLDDPEGLHHNRQGPSWGYFGWLNRAKKECDILNVTVPDGYQPAPRK